MNLSNSINHVFLLRGYNDVKYFVIANEVTAKCPVKEAISDYAGILTGVNKIKVMNYIGDLRSSALAGQETSEIVCVRIVCATHHDVIANEVTAKRPVKEAISEAEG